LVLPRFARSRFVCPRAGNSISKIQAGNLWLIFPKTLKPAGAPLQLVFCSILAKKISGEDALGGDLVWSHVTPYDGPLAGNVWVFEADHPNYNRFAVDQHAMKLFTKFGLHFAS